MNGICPICTGPAVSVGHFPDDGGATPFFKCQRCGRFGLASGLVGAPVIPDEIRPYLSAAARQGTEMGSDVILRSGNLKLLAGPHQDSTVTAKIDKLLRVVAKGCSHPGGGFQIDPDIDYPLADCSGKLELQHYLAYIEKQGWLLTYPDLGHNEKLSCVLTIDGWLKVQPLPLIGGIPGRCFVAMWFDSSMNEAFEFGISKAVIACGLPAPIRIDRKEHNNQITDEIMAEIRNAEFVIADFTEHRGGV